MWAFVRGELDAGRQAYVVCPLIDESEVLEAASARATFEELCRGELARLPPPSAARPAASRREAGRHGGLRRRRGRRVGQHHRHRGGGGRGQRHRHGDRGRPAVRALPAAPAAGSRGPGRGRLVLPAPGRSEDPVMLERLELFARTNDGFGLAEADLRARGEGQLFGERQSGWGDLRVARLLRDGASWRRPGRSHGSSCGRTPGSSRRVSDSWARRSRRVSADSSTGWTGPEGAAACRACASSPESGRVIA